jgi:hypothetical protein
MLASMITLYMNVLLPGTYRTVVELDSMRAAVHSRLIVDAIARRQLPSTTPRERG